MTAFFGFWLAATPPLAMQRAEPKPRASMREVDAVIKDLLARQPASYHTWLRDASRKVSPLLIGQPLVDIQKTMRQHRFPVTEAWENGDAVHAYYLLRQSKFVFQSTLPLDAYLLLSASNPNPHSMPARPGAVYSADIALGAETNGRYTAVTRKLKAPRGSILDRILMSKEVKSDGERWPILKRILVYYGPMCYISGMDTRYGFHADVEFAASATKQIGGKSLYLFVESGLDPTHIPFWPKRPATDFVPRDVLGKIERTGSNEWWKGNPPTVVANERRYLKRVKPSQRD
jgi:hypothetical protein